MNLVDERVPVVGSRDMIIIDDLTIEEMIYLIGWTLQEFVEACADYNGEETYDWHKVLTRLWESTYNRIHSQLDVTHRFRYYNDWKYAGTYALTLTKSRMTDPEFCDSITLRDLEEYLEDKSRKNKHILPTEPDEKRIIWDIMQIILHLYHCTQKHAQWSFPQIVSIRESVELLQKEIEDRHTARRNRRRNKKSNKNNHK